MFMLIAIVFIAELIIAFQLITLIKKADRKVCDINACVKEFNPLAQTYMQYVRCLTTSATSSVQKILKFIEKQKSQFLIKTVVTFSLYAGLVIFKLKKIKIRKIGNLIGAISDIALDLAV